MSLFTTVPGTWLMLLLYMLFIFCMSRLVRKATLSFEWQDPHLFCLAVYPLSPAHCLAYIGA